MSKHRFLEPPPSETRLTIPADPTGTPDEVEEQLIAYRESLNLPENFILRSQRSFPYVEL